MTREKRRILQQSITAIRERIRTGNTRFGDHRLLKTQLAELEEAGKK